MAYSTALAKEQHPLKNDTGVEEHFLHGNEGVIIPHELKQSVAEFTLSLFSPSTSTAMTATVEGDVVIWHQESIIIVWRVNIPAWETYSSLEQQQIGDQFGEIGADQATGKISVVALINNLMNEGEKMTR
ncbi:hypothetical protein R1sor_005414 [Riccia sorocarpa]|uniref:Uncharacterized protein n=1 Tax=Riccia sorocarpa TaxID=122646 RepID=A0ABD3HJZ2_9MARC